VSLLSNPVALYICIALGAVGVALALPRPRVSPQLLGGFLAAIALGGVFLSLGLKAGSARPGVFFYVFATISLGSALRVITHPRPVYSALYFILTVLSSSALYLMLQAEFMAFALVIIYAGAILITYLFVIMLAEQAPSNDEGPMAARYDRSAREPLAASAVGFALLGLLTVMVARGLSETSPAEPRARGAALLAEMPKRVLDALNRSGAFEAGLSRPTIAEVGRLVDAEAWTIEMSIADAVRFRERVGRPGIAALFGGSEPARRLGEQVRDGQVVLALLPPELRIENIDGVGFTLIAEHPMGLELAGVILLMAMIGAVVLARKQIEIGEAEKAMAASGEARA